MKFFAFQTVLLVFAITVFGRTLNKRDIIEDILQSVDENGKSCPLNTLVQSTYDENVNLTDEEIDKMYSEGVAETCKSDLCIDAYISFFEAYINETPSRESSTVSEHIADLKNCNNGIAANVENGASPLVLNSGLLFITIFSLLYYLI